MAKDQRFKVTVHYYDRPKKVYRNQTNKQALELERSYVTNPTVVKSVQVQNETNLRAVKDDKC